VNIRVLHLAPHYGGGVGTVVRALIAESQRLGGYTHRLACLEAASEATRAWAGRLGVGLADRLHWDDEALKQALSDTDLVHLHWWHHPLLNAMMHRWDLPPFRCVLWTHVNGHHPPQNFPLGLVDYPDLLVLATSWSLKAPALAEAVAQGRDIRVVRSSAGIPKMPPRVERGDGPVRVGYVGTVDPIKMHPDFIRLCLEADVPGRIVVAGGPCHEDLRAAAKAVGAEDRFEILGPIDDVPALMSRLDVLAYPLNPQHYGTGEQVLLEAVAAGVVPVVLGTENEQETLDLLGCGLTADTEEDFVVLLRQITTDTAILLSEYRRCASASDSELDINKITTVWHQIYDKTFKFLSKPHRICGIDHANPRPHELLLASCQGTKLADLYSRLIKHANFDEEDWQGIPNGCLAKTRGSCFHYGKFYDDPALKQITAAFKSRLTG
jgi:L-malate glycosyltransferase